ncbi:hypothetical protein B0H13DRAFT_1909417 [Mycena leptocephala]|nr:hypothetical protein B0H13DRAFT_1909417 [Mycena leptocephala]
MSRQQSREFADANGRLRLRPRLRLFTCDSHKDPKALIRKHPSRQVVVPGSLSPLDPAGAGAEIYGLQGKNFSHSIDLALMVLSSPALTSFARNTCVRRGAIYQDKDELSKVYNKMTAKFPWLAHYDNYWPVSGRPLFELDPQPKWAEGAEEEIQRKTMACRDGRSGSRFAGRGSRVAHTRSGFTGTRNKGREPLKSPIPQAKVSNFIPATSPAILHNTMVNNRKPVTIRKSFLRELRCRHYSTSHNTPRFAFTPTHIEYCKPDASRYPLVESIFSDAAHQPWIHDFNALNANACANTIAGDVVIMRVAAHDTTSVVNMRSTDSRIADYVFHAALQRMTKFQSVHRTRLPKELTVYRAHAFPGSP